MSDLRERAAIAAMNGLLCDGADRRTSGPVSTVQTAVEYADALLAELARTALPVRPENAPQPSVPNEVLQPGTKLYVFQDGKPKVTAEVPPELRCLDAASYHAGLEAAAKLFEDQAKLSTDAAWSEQLCDMASEIRALPTPSTLPEKPQC